jgi:hypothetical protein
MDRVFVGAALNDCILEFGRLSSERMPNEFPLQGLILEYAVDMRVRAGLTHARAYGEAHRIVSTGFGY